MIAGAWREVERSQTTRRQGRKTPWLVGTVMAAVTLAACTEEPCGAHPGQLCLVVGTGELGFNRDGLAPEDTDLFRPTAARRGPDGLLYIMDFNTQRLRRISEEGTVETLAGNGFHAFAADGSPAQQSPLENPIDFGFLADGRLVFVSYHDPRVLMIAEDGTLQTLAGAADGFVGSDGDEGDGGPALDALFIQLDGIAIAPDDTIYVSDSGAHRVRKIEDGIIDTVAGTGEIGYSGDGGPASEAALYWPSALALDAQGNLLIADTRNHAIRRLGLDGTLTTVAGTGVEGAAGDGGPATEAQLSQPWGIACAVDGTLYIGDGGNHRVRRVDSEGLIDTVAGTGVDGPGGAGPALESTLGFVARVAVDGDQLLVTDYSNSKVWRLTLP